MLTTDQKGAIAELAVAQAAVEAGVGVYLPFADERADMLFELGRTILRVQCKWATRYDDVIIVRCYRARRNANGLLRQFHSANDIDLFGVYCASMRRCFLIPFSDVPPGASIQLRVAPTKNNQARKIRWASDYEFDATLRRLGAVAQLGERRAGSAQGTGSSPVGSTSEAASPEAALF
jgi:hypothetical protein